MDEEFVLTVFTNDDEPVTRWSDASVEEAPRNGDLETAKLFGKRVAELTRKLN